MSHSNTSFDYPPNTSGQNSRNSKLTDEQAREIYMSDESHQALSDRYGVSTGVISGIRRRATWLKATEGLKRANRGLPKSEWT